MSIEKNIRLTTDATQVESAFKRVQQAAQESSNVLMQEAEKRSGSSKDMLKYLEDEIKAMERANRLEMERRNIAIRDKMSRDPEHKKDYQEQLTNLRIEDRENRLQTELLRDLIDTVIRTSKEEIAENKKGVEDRITSTPASSRDFKMRLQASLLGMENLDESKKLRDQDVQTGRFAGGVRGYGTAVIGANNMYDAGFNVAGMAGSQIMAGGMPLVGLTVALGALLGKKLFDTYQMYSRAEGQSYAMIGRGSTDMGLGYSAWGYSGTDYMNAMSSLARIRRSGTGIEAATRSQLLMQRGLGMDPSLFGSMEQLSMIGGGSGYSNVQSSIAAMRASGIVKGGDMTPVQDYLQIMVQLSREQLSRLGSVDMGVNSKMVAALANMDENLKKSPEALTTMVNAIRGGLTGGSPQAQALQYSVLSKLAPGSSMFELMEMRENPFSEKSIKYMPEYLKQLKGLSGSDDRFFMNIMQQFGLSASMSRKLGEGFMSGDLQSILKQEFTGKTGVDNLEERAKRSTSAKDVATAWAENLAITVGDELVGIGNNVKTITSQVQQNTEAINKIADEITAQGGIGNRITGTLMRLPPNIAF